MKPYWSNGRVVLWQGHVLDCLAAMEAQSVQCAVTSPPYWGLRDYDLPSLEWGPVSYAPMAGLPPLDIPGCDSGCEHVWGEELEREASHRNEGFGNRQAQKGQRWSATNETEQEQKKGASASQGQYCQLCGGWRGCLGLEPTPEMFVGHIVLVARELWRVLRDDGTFWLNFGDSYASGPTGSLGSNTTHVAGKPTRQKQVGMNRPSKLVDNLKPKDLIGIPWRVAFALQADGWYLRSDIIWAKGVSFCPTYSGSCMPGSQKDRPTTGHEHVFLLTKKPRYFYDNEAVKEPCSTNTHSRGPEYHKLNKTQEPGLGIKDNESWSEATWGPVSKRGLRSVWTINPGSYAGAHFATFPPALVEPMIRAGTSSKGCCPECGAPWVRVTEKTAEIDPSAKGSRFDKGKTGVNGSGRTQEGERYLSKSTGWAPTCSHYDALYYSDFAKPKDPRKWAQRAMSGNWFKRARKRPGLDHWPVDPCTVLDPFLGSGTTAEVADFLGRHSVGIELSKKYCDDHIIPRLTEPLFEWAVQEQQEPEPEIEQLGLL